MTERVERIAGLRTIVVEAANAPQLCVIMLHGYAMSPDVLAPFAHSLGISARFLFPEGPLAAVPQGSAWWPLDLEARARAMAHGPRDLSKEHPPGVTAARERLLTFLANVRAGSRDLPLALAGFSQGGMLACDTVLREQPQVGALALMSASCIALDEWMPLAHRVKGLPVLVSHGKRDPDLAFSAGEGLRDFLAQGGARITWVPFEEGHEIPLLVWRALKKFFNDALRAT